jgi:hypothetical protein
MNRSKQPRSRKQKIVHVFPPQIEQKPIHNRKLRFVVVTAVANLPLYRFDLLKLTYTTGTAAVSGVTNWSAVQLRKVEAWTVDTTGALASASLEWQSSRGPSKMVLASGNINRPAHISTKPPPGSLASFWSQVRDGSVVNNEVLCYLTLPVGTVLDLDINFVMANGPEAEDECISLAVVAGGTIETNYCNALDNSGAAPGYLIRPDILFTRNAT